MSYIDTAWLNCDRHAKNLVQEGWYSDCSDKVDSDLEAMLFDVGVEKSEIPVDASGYFNNVHLRKIGTDYALYVLFYSNKGVEISEQGVDVYMTKSIDCQIAYDDAVQMLRRSMVV